MFRLVSVFLFFLIVAANSKAAEQSLEAFVQIKSDEILTLVNEGRAEFESDPSVLYGQMGAVLDELVDFAILTRGIT